MDIHINKKIAGLMIVSLLVGGALGGAIGFVAGGEEGHGDRGRYEMNDTFDTHADGETNDDQGGIPNQDEQTNTTGTQTTVSPVAPVPAQ